MYYLLSAGAPFKSYLPYQNSRTQEGFGTFGPLHIQAWIMEPARRAIITAFFHKWYVHRRARPEEYAARVHLTKTGQASYPVHSDVLNSTVLDRVFQQQGTYLLSQAYPEGSPHHPAFPAGHATIAGCLATILKAWFNESFVIPNPVVYTLSGFVPYVGEPLTVGGELNKLACETLCSFPRLLLC
jgi:hypothetical protein